MYKNDVIKWTGILVWMDEWIFIGRMDSFVLILDRPCRSPMGREFIVDSNTQFLCY